MGTRKLVSVVDDDEFVREALPDLLRSYGLEALPFGSAEDFLASEHLGRTGCLILDVSMPGMSDSVYYRQYRQSWMGSTPERDGRLSHQTLQRRRDTGGRKLCS